MATKLSALAKRRLGVLAAFLRTVPKKVFDLGHWADGDVEMFAGCSIPPKKFAEVHTCGTTACALGWATTIPAFRRAGLSLHLSGAYGRPDVRFGGRVNVDAAKEFFGIPEAVGETFFYPSSYKKEQENISAKDVAARIEAYLTDPDAYKKKRCHIMYPNGHLTAIEHNVN